MSTWQPGDPSAGESPHRPRRRPTIGDVARLSGVSTATVSRVLSGAAKVSAARHAQVLRAIEQLEYNPSDLTRAVFGGRSNGVGVVVADLRNPYYVDLMRGVESVVTEDGGLVFLASTSRDRERERSIMRAMDAQHLRGLVVTTRGDLDDDVRRMADRGTECVFVTRPVGLRHPRVHSVRVDDEAVGALAWEHLHGRGRRNVVVVVQWMDSLTQQARVRGLREAARRDGVELDDDSIVELGTLDRRVGDLAGVLADRRGAGRPPVDAVFAATGIATLRAYEELVAAGARVPDDVAFVGFDDFPWAPYLAWPLTLVTQPALEIGRRAAGIVIDEPGAAQDVVMPPALVVRAST